MPGLLIEAIFARDAAEVQRRLDAGAQPDVWECAALGHAAALRDWIRRDRTLLEMPGPGGFAPLHLAAHYGRLAALRALLDEGASPGLLGAPPLSNAPLHAAVAGRQRASAEALLDAGAPVDARDHGGHTALHVAAANGDVELARLLLARGADPDARAADGRTPRDVARERGNGEAEAALAARGA
jgi:ankyrin repeat protein